MQSLRLLESHLSESVSHKQRRQRFEKRDGQCRHSCKKNRQKIYTSNQSGQFGLKSLFCFSLFDDIHRGSYSWELLREALSGGDSSQVQEQLYVPWRDGR